MVTLWITTLLAICIGCGTAVGQPCPASKGPMVRIGNSRYFIFHKPNVRSYHHSFSDAKKLCEKNNMKMATIKDIATFHYLGRQIEEWVHTTSAKDTWYWLDARFDHGKESYFWGDGTNDQLKFTNFFYRYPRPSGVASQVDWMDVYQKNSTVEQCLAFALPLPRVETGKNGAVIYGFSTTFDEKPCEGRKNGMLSVSPVFLNVTQKYRIHKNQYFDDGNWIVGNRRYIVSWKQRNRNESEAYCAKIGLQMYNPFDDDRAALPHLKLWSRNVTMSQFWTSWTYKVENGNGMFLDSAGKQVAEQRSFIKYSDLTGRSNKNSLEFCVASQFYYEFKQQLPCSDNDKACSWSGISTVPTNCNNYLGTICQHKDHEKRLIVWNTEYIKSPETLINDGIQATIEFGWKGNDHVRRSRFKQTFGSLVCPPKHRMLREEEDKWHILPQNYTEVYLYDFLDSYWVVDQEFFTKTQTSQCSISVPTNTYGTLRRIQKVPCTEWHFYLCKFEKLEIRKPNNALPYTPPKSAKNMEALNV